MAKLNSKRLFWADVVRIFAIFLVVFVHSVHAGNDFLSYPLGFAIAVCCVPLFVMLSGALLLSKTESYKTFYKKRLTRLLLPWIFWTFIYFLVAFFQMPKTGIVESFSLLSKTFSSFWFLPMIAALYIITPALRILTANAKTKDLILLIVLWFVSVSVLPYLRNTMAFPLFVDDGLVRQTVSYIGYYLAGFVLTKIKLPNNWGLFFMFVLGVVISLTTYYFRQQSALTNPGLAYAYIAPGVVISSISFFAIIFNLEAFLKKANAGIKNFIISLSLTSYGILFVHQLISINFMKIFGFSLYIYVPVAQAFVNAFILFSLSYLTIWAISRFALFRKLVT